MRALDASPSSSVRLAIRLAGTLAVLTVVAVVAVLAAVAVLALPAARADAGGQPPAAAPRRAPAAAAPRQAGGAVLPALPVALPGGAGGIGFDDLGFAPALGKLLVPAGRTGNLDLIDTASRQIVAIAGFSSQGTFAKGHGEGTTSADFGRGLIFATDRTAKQLVVVDPATRTIVARAGLAGSPDYVRWVAPTGEVWVTQPDSDRIEIFALPAAGPPVPVHKAFVATPGGPESLVVDAARRRAYTHLWKSATLAIDLDTRAIAARWPNRCADSRGIALDARRGLLFAGCAEGKAVVLDVLHGGAVRDTLCVVADDRHQAWVCDPGQGRLLLVDDTLPAVE